MCAKIWSQWSRHSPWLQRVWEEPGLFSSSAPSYLWHFQVVLASFWEMNGVQEPWMALFCDFCSIKKFTRSKPTQIKTKENVPMNSSEAWFFGSSAETLNKRERATIDKKYSSTFSLYMGLVYSYECFLSVRMYELFVCYSSSKNLWARTRICVSIF